MNRHLVYGIVVVALAAVLAYVLLERPSGARVVAKYGDKEISLDFDETEIELTQILDRIFSNPESELDRIAVLAILAEKYDTYHKNSPYFVAKIREEDAGTGLSEEIRGVLYSLQGPFRRDQHSYYDITKEEFLAALETMGFDNPVAVELYNRHLAFSGIFQLRKQSAFVEFVDSVEAGSAAACSGSTFIGKELLISDPVTSRSLTVMTKSLIGPTGPCVQDDGEINKTNFIQLSRQDAECLTGSRTASGTVPITLYQHPAGMTIRVGNNCDGGSS